jgi:hypothetical protein
MAITLSPLRIHPGGIKDWEVDLANFQDRTQLSHRYNESQKVVTPIGNDSHTLWFSKSRIARSWMPPKTGPIPRGLLEPALYSSGMTAQDSRALPHNYEWQALTSRNSHVVFLSEFGETDTAP